MISWAALSDNEKNILVAEKIFGLIPCQSRSYTPLIAGYTEVIRCEHTIISDRPLHCYDPKRPRNYLTGNGMLEVMEKMKGRCHFILWYNALPPDLPSAVALAALRAVGIEIGD